MPWKKQICHTACCLLWGVQLALLYILFQSAADNQIVAVIASIGFLFYFHKIERIVASYKNVER